MSTQPDSQARPIPRLPVLGWDTFSGKKQAPIPCILDAPNLAFTTSGRASIYQALKILGITTGTSVIIPTYHCPTMVAPVVALGATPIFCPIDSTGHINISALDGIARPDTKAILAPHYFGLPQPMDELRAWCDVNGIALIEDCAHALFGISGERNIGQWGDLAIASLTKFLPLPEGGCLLCNRDQKEYVALDGHGPINQIKAALDMIEEGVRHEALPGLNAILRNIFGIKKSLKSAPLQTVSATDSDGISEVETGHLINPDAANTRLAVACRWLARHATRERVVINRRRNYRYLAQALSGSTAFHPLKAELPEYCAPYVFPLWVERPDPSYQQLRAAGIPLFRWDNLWPDTPSIPEDYGIKWSHHIFQLVCHQDLREDELDRIAVKLTELCT